MRIAILNAHRAQLGGIETYLHTIIAALANAGHQVAFLHQFATPSGRQPLFLPPGAPAWCTALLGLEPSIAALRAWRPDTLLVNSMDDSALEAAALAVAPAVLFAHGYYGTCVSGNKMFAFPRLRPCGRTLGWQCLLHYYPHRCGGLNPLTMWRDYRVQSAELARLPRYAAVLTASTHMRQEYLHHGVLPSRVHLAPYPVIDGALDPAAATPEEPDIGTPLQLLFCGRMTPLKGGQLMLDALPLVHRALRRPIRAIFAGDGPARGGWESQARRLADRHAGALEIEFTGWLDSAGLNRIRRQSHLIVVPSAWPEPFALVGPEAGLHGLPAAAFAVGGITDWLSDGVNGYLAPADPPQAAGLARAIVACLGDPDTYARLRVGARLKAASFTVDRHLQVLLGVLGRSAGQANHP